MHNIFVWTLDDVIGVILFGLLLIGAILFIGYAYLAELWGRWRGR